MSGLVAVFHRDRRPVERGEAEAMLRAIPHRGQDGMRLLLANDVALGHARMVTRVAQHQETQPCMSPRTGCVVVADARIDNRDQLLAELGLSAARRLPDAELILHSFERFGSCFAEKLVGDFAIIIWDPSAQEMVCYRDPYGQRTLFYRITGQSFLVGSEIHQLFANGIDPIIPNQDRVTRALVPLYFHQDELEDGETFFDGVGSVIPGSAMRVGRRDSKRISYYCPGPGREIRYRQSSEYADHLLSIFTEAVKCRARTDFPLAYMLSGGLDSSSIVCAAEVSALTDDSLARQRVVISARYAYPECDERPFIQEVLDTYGLVAHFTPGVAFARRLHLEPQGFRHSPRGEGPSERDGLWPLAVKAGARVVLTGDLGDACISGYPEILDRLLFRGRLRDFLRQVSWHRQFTRQSWKKILALYCLGPLLPARIHTGMAAYAGLRAQRRIGEMLPAYLPAPLRETLRRRHLDDAAARERSRSTRSEARQRLYWGLYPPRIADPPFGWPFEVALPYADRRLHEFVLAVPPEQLFLSPDPGGGEYPGAKLLLRQAMRGILPERIRTRTDKPNFGAPFIESVASHWRDYEEAFGPGGQSEVARYGLIDPPRFWNRLLQLREGYYGWDGWWLFNLFLLETWLRTFRQPRGQHLRAAPWVQVETPRLTVVNASDGAEARVV